LKSLAARKKVAESERERVADPRRRHRC
jgi:hypothetical protein